MKSPLIYQPNDYRFQTSPETLSFLFWLRDSINRNEIDTACKEMMMMIKLNNLFLKLTTGSGLNRLKSCLYIIVYLFVNPGVVSSFTVNDDVDDGKDDLRMK